MAASLDSQSRSRSQSQQPQRKRRRFSYFATTPSEESPHTISASVNDAEDTKATMAELQAHIQKLVEAKEEAIPIHERYNQPIQEAQNRVQKAQAIYDWAKNTRETLPAEPPHDVRGQVFENEQAAEVVLQEAKSGLNEVTNNTPFSSRGHHLNQGQSQGQGQNDNDAAWRELGSLQVISDIIRIGPAKFYALLESDRGFASKLKLQSLANNEGHELEGDQ